MTGEKPISIKKKDVDDKQKKEAMKTVLQLFTATASSVAVDVFFQHVT